MTAREIEESRDLVRRYWELKGHDVSNVSAESLHHSRQGALVYRCCARFREFGGENGSQTIVKFHEDDRSSIAFAAMAVLARSLDATDPLGVPTPFLHVPHRRAVVQQHVPGVACTELFPTDASRYIAGRIGLALACLHSQRNLRGETKTVTDHVRELIRPDPRELLSAFPEYREPIETTLYSLQQQSTEAIPHVPLHRDFQLRQMFFDGIKIWVVDWDTFALGDAAFDVAYFLAYLRTHYRCCDDLERAFLDGYFETQGESTFDRIPIYLAFNFLRRACRRYRLRDAKWNTEIRRMMRLLDATLSRW